MLTKINIPSGVFRVLLSHWTCLPAEFQQPLWEFCLLDCLSGLSAVFSLDPGTWSTLAGVMSVRCDECPSVLL